LSYFGRCSSHFRADYPKKFARKPEIVVKSPDFQHAAAALSGAAAAREMAE
jgi:hypothetical protein